MFEQDVAGRWLRLSSVLVRAVPSLADPTRTYLSGLIKALRANKNDEQSVIEQALEECRKEIKKSDVDLKAAAVLKLVYVSAEVTSWADGSRSRRPRLDDQS